MKQILRNPPENCPNGEACITAATEDQRKWHFDKSVSMGHIVTTIVALCSFVYWAMKQENRLTKLEDHAIAATKADDIQDAERKELRTEIRNELREIRAMLEARPKR